MHRYRWPQRRRKNHTPAHLLGERPLDEGTVKIGKRVVFNYIDQARMQLVGTGTVLEEISEGNETVLFGEQRLSARSYLRRFCLR